MRNGAGPNRRVQIGISDGDKSRSALIVARIAKANMAAWGDASAPRAVLVEER